MADGFARDGIFDTLEMGLVILDGQGRGHTWYRAADTQRGQGEAMSIRQMIRCAESRFGSDPKRVFIAGLSAGGAMAAAMLAAYPAVFNAGGIVAACR